MISNKPAIIRAILALAATLIASSALGAIELGWMSNAQPSNPTAEVLYVNHLLLMAPEAFQEGILLPEGGPGRPHDFTRTSEDVPGSREVSLAGVAGGGTATQVVGYEYLLAKYDGYIVVWYLGGAVFTPPASSTGLGLPADRDLGHWRAFNVVPEPATLLAGAGALVLLLFGAGIHSKRTVLRIGR